MHIYIVITTTGGKYTIFLDLVCSVYVVTITTGVTYSFIISSKSGLHISVRLCSVYIVTNTTGVAIFLWFPLKVVSINLDLVSSVYVVAIIIGINYTIFLDLVCSVYVVTITIGVTYSFMISFKSGFHMSRPSMFSLCSDHFNFGIYSVMISSKSGFHISGPSMFRICSNHFNFGKL